MTDEQATGVEGGYVDVAGSLDVYAVVGGDLVAGAVDFDGALTLDHEDQYVLLGVRDHPVSVAWSEVHVLDHRSQIGVGQHGLAG